jgi:alpha/beta superfamily hydrolase
MLEDVLMNEIRSTTELPAIRRDIELHTKDGHVLVGELSVPESGSPVGTLLFLHPLPTAGGYMDSHIIRKAALRLPAMAGLAVLRFNFRGVTSPRGRSEGEFGHGVDERLDLEAALEFIHAEGLPSPWVIGWSFGTEVALNHTINHDVAGLILLAPPLHRTTPETLDRWNENSTPIVAVIPEHDDYLRPEEARERFAVVPRIEIVEVKDGKHLWVGEKQTYRVLSEIVERVNPSALPLPTTFG